MYGILFVIEFVFVFVSLFSFSFVFVIPLEMRGEETQVVNSQKHSLVLLVWYEKADDTEAGGSLCGDSGDSFTGGGAGASDEGGSDPADSCGGSLNCLQCRKQ